MTISVYRNLFIHYRLIVSVFFFFFLYLQAADIGIMSTQYREFAKEQIHYMLGDGGRSYVVGFGENYPLQPHHAAR